MNENDDTPTDPSTSDRPDPANMAALQAQIDERDETIRLLNEALSHALDELDLREAA